MCAAAGCLGASGATAAIQAQVDTHTFGLNLYFIIGALVVGLAVLVVMLVLWIAVRCLVWEIRLRRAAAEAGRIHIGPDGLPYPPVGRGLCEVCAIVSDKVYHLASGQRMCEDCYRRLCGTLAPQGGETAQSGGPETGSGHGN